MQLKMFDRSALVYILSLVRVFPGGGERRRSAVKMAAIFKCYCLTSISLTSFLTLSVIKERERREGWKRERGRGRHSKISERKNNARYSWGNHLASNLFFPLSLPLSSSLTHTHTHTLSLLLIYHMHT